MAAAGRKTLEELFRKIQRGGGCPVLGVEGRVPGFPVLAALRREMLGKPSGSKLIQTQDPPSETEGGAPCVLLKGCLNASPALRDFCNHRIETCEEARS